MVTETTRGEVWWADLADPLGSEPGFSRPVVIIQGNSFNSSRIKTVIIAVLSSNTRLADAPGNVLVPATVSGLARDSVVNVSQLLTIDRSFLRDFVGTIPRGLQRRIDDGLRLALDL